MMAVHPLRGGMDLMVTNKICCDCLSQKLPNVHMVHMIRYNINIIILLHVHSHGGATDKVVSS